MAIRLTIGPRRNNSVLRAVVGGGVCLGLSIVGFAVVFSAETIAGGLPFVPHDLNQGIARVVFGLGAVLTASMALYAFYEAWAIHRDRARSR
ncbi:MAG: hypothetical protein JJT93_06685 [Gammaproteobacteria bacterium]|nr:hypothetical protein [Gammaproteobacteria bacterium]